MLLLGTVCHVLQSFYVFLYVWDVVLLLFCGVCPGPGLRRRRRRRARRIIWTTQMLSHDEGSHGMTA